MKRSIKNVCIFICIALMFSLFTPVGATGQQTALIDSDALMKDEKIYANATIEQEFVDNHILVIMDRSVSSINKTHEFSTLSSIDISSVSDLTQIDLPQLQAETNVYSLSNEQLDSAQSVPLVNTESFRQILLLELPTHSKANVLEVIKKLESVEGIMYAGPDYVTHINATVPNDSYIIHQWAIQKIQLDEAWDITTGSSDVYVGVADTGIASHPDLNANVVGGWDFVNNNSTTTDDINGHGTHIAGIIGAVGNNEIGVAGVSWNVKIVPLQITYDEEGHSYLSDGIEAITYAINNNIPVLNFSSGGLGINSEAFKQAIANYQGLFVCSAGNDNTNTDTTFHHPSCYNLPNMISVANSTQIDKLGLKSNYGVETVHLAAPGSSIRSCYLDAGYLYKQGTSMAAPHVAGVAALILSLRPNLTPEEVKAYILDNVDKVDDFENLCITGGRLNAYKAVRAATESETFVADANNDGRSDVILSQNFAGKRQFTVFLGKANGGFEYPVISNSTHAFSYSDPAYVGDFNGDGYTDIIIHWVSGYDRQLLVYIGTGTGAFNEGVNFSSVRDHTPNANPSKFFVDDVNGDGKDDFIVHFRDDNGNRCALVYKGQSASPYFSDATTNALTSTNEYRPNDPVFVGDFNGDGYADMLVQWANSSEKRQLLIYTGRADGTFNAGVNLSSSRKHIPSTYPTKFFVADVNGDGKDDFVVQWRNSDGKRCNLVYKGKASSPYFTDATTDAIVSTNNYIETDPVFVGDVNGDGRSDMIVHWVNDSGYRQFLIYTANSDGTYNTPIRQSTGEYHDPSEFAETMFVSDVNGDGKDDFIVKLKGYYDGVEFMTYLGTSDGSFTSAILTTPTINILYYDSLVVYNPGTYKITNVGANKCLNIKGSNLTSLTNHQNVTLWPDSGTNEQKWYITSVGEGAYVKSVIDLSFGLNVYRSGDPWNCDVYPISGNETDALVDFVPTKNGFKIKLHNYDLYLTTASSANGSNIFWGAESSSAYQLWDLTPV